MESNDPSPPRRRCVDSPPPRAAAWDGDRGMPCLIRTRWSVESGGSDHDDTNRGAALDTSPPRSRVASATPPPPPPVGTPPPIEVVLGDAGSLDVLARCGVTLEQVTAVVGQVIEDEHALVAAAAAAVVSAAASLDPRSQPTGVKRRLEYHFEIDNCVQGMSGAQIYASFRMNLVDLYELLDDLRPHLQTKHPEKGVASCGHAITAGQRLLIGLRMMFGAAYQDVMMTFPPISQGRVFVAFWTFVDAINSVYGGRWGFPMPPPVDDHSIEAFLARQESTEALQELERRNAAGSTQHVWRGQVGAIDGAIIKMRSPGMAVKDPKVYFCQRKQCFALLLMAMADADRRIIWCVLGTRL